MTQTTRAAHRSSIVLAGHTFCSWFVLPSLNLCVGSVAKECPVCYTSISCFVVGSVRSHAELSTWECCSFRIPMRTSLWIHHKNRKPFVSVSSEKHLFQT